MSRTVYPLLANDISVLARSLVRQWAAQETSPGHLQMLNMLARAVGFQNFQHFQSNAQVAALAPPVGTPPASDDLDEAATRQVQRLLRHFDAQGRLIRWPTKFSEQKPCLWPIWARIPARQEMSEREVNEFIRPGEVFGDHVLVRRELVNYGMLQRTRDGSVYRRIEQPIPAETAQLMREVLRRDRAPS